MKLCKVCATFEQQGFQTSSLIFDFTIDDSLKTAPMDVGNGGENLLRGEKLSDLEYPDDIVLLCDDTQTIQSTLSQLPISVRSYGI